MQALTPLALQAHSVCVPGGSIVTIALAEVVGPTHIPRLPCGPDSMLRCRLAFPAGAVSHRFEACPGRPPAREAQYCRLAPRLRSNRAGNQRRQRKIPPHSCTLECEAGRHCADWLRVSSSAFLWDELYNVS